MNSDDLRQNPNAAAIRNDLADLHDALLERIEETETHLLTEFRKWALRIEATLKPQPARIAGLEERITLAEERLDKLEAEEIRTVFAAG